MVKVASSTDRDLYVGLFRLLVLHRACEEPIYGVRIIEEMSQKGYTLSPGTLYPLLHGLENKGYLRSRKERNGKCSRRVYAITAKGRHAASDAKKTSLQTLWGALRTRNVVPHWRQGRLRSVRPAVYRNRVINYRLPRGVNVGIHDIVYVNRMVDALQKHPEFVAWPRGWAGPR